jgi:hypothetical protein
MTKMWFDEHIRKLVCHGQSNIVTVRSHMQGMGGDQMGHPLGTGFLYALALAHEGGEGGQPG